MDQHSQLIETSDPLGFIYIDDTRFSLSLGGIRLIEGVDRKEVKLLAKAMSNKLFTFHFPISGAKGGVNSNELDDFYKFISKPEVKEIIRGSKTHQFITGPDIGTSESEYYTALKNVGLDHLIRKGLLSEQSEAFELPMDNIVTAFGVVVAAEEILRRNKMIDPFLNKQYVLEGFGKVGTGIAKILQNRAKLVAISTKFGFVEINPTSKFSTHGGFDIEKIIQLKEQFGDRFIFETDLEVLPTSDLFEVSCDLIIPGARTEVITKEIARKIIKARPVAVVPVSNYPYTEEGLQLLESAGIICFPDFISSAGAVIAAMVEFADVGGQEEAMSLVHAAINQETRDLLLAAKACTDHTKTMYQIAIDRVEVRKKQQLAYLKSRESFSIDEIARNTVSKYLPSLLNRV